MEISLSIEERPPVLRAFLEELQIALGDDARVWASMVAGDEQASQQIAAFVQVFEAPDHDAALQRVRPAIRVADPEMRIVRSEASSLQEHRTRSTNGAGAHGPAIEATTEPDARVNSAALAQSHVQQRFELC